jgi:hypothetical protein
MTLKQVFLCNSGRIYPEIKVGTDIALLKSHMDQDQNSILANRRMVENAHG